MVIVVDAEYGEEGEVGGDLGLAPEAGSSPAVVPAHQVPDGPVVRLPGGVA